MSLSKERYGFPLDWFLSSSRKNSHSFDMIDELYKLYYLDYSLFIKSFKKEGLLTSEEEIICLKREKKCISCKSNYPYTWDIFLHIVSGDNDITSDLCYDCILKATNCKKCNSCLYQEPYTTLEFTKSRKICENCKD